MELPYFLQPLVHYFFARPFRFLALAGIGILASLIYHLWLQKTQAGSKHWAFPVIVGGVVAVPLLLSSLLSSLWSVFCFLGGPDGKLESRSTIVAAIVFALTAIVSLLAGLWDVRAGLKMRSR